MENELVTAIGILFPTRQLIIQGERHALFEFTVVVRSQTNSHALHLQSETDIKILGDVCIRPPLCLAIRRIHKLNTLNSLPPEESVVANEGRYITGANTILDSGINNIGKISN